MDALTGFLPPGQVNDPPLPLMDSSWKIPPEGKGGFKRFERGNFFFFFTVVGGGLQAQFSPEL